MTKEFIKAQSDLNRRINETVKEFATDYPDVPVVFIENAVEDAHSEARSVVHDARKVLA